MAHVALILGPNLFDSKRKLMELQKAQELAPDSPVPFYYTGRNLDGIPGREREALTAFRMAAQLGDDDTKAIIDKRLKDRNIESLAKSEQEAEDIRKSQAAQKQ